MYFAKTSDGWTLCKNSKVTRILQYVLRIDVGNEVLIRKATEYIA